MPERVGAKSSGNEVFTGRVRIDCPSLRFHAHGKAAGPYPGTFIASGHWAAGIVFIGTRQVFEWDFKEKFTITSGASRVSGTIKGGSYGLFGCTWFGPETLRYTSNYGDGNADIQIIEKGDFSETLDGL
jgi:hypothetical protein